MGRRSSDRGIEQPLTCTGAVHLREGVDPLELPADPGLLFVITGGQYHQNASVEVGIISLGA